MITIYTDGACSMPSMLGGWGVVLISGEHVKEISGGESATTNNRMELTACIMALESIKMKDIPIEIYTDSKYVQNGITDWIANWKRNGWISANKKPVKNIDLWQRLDDARSCLNIEWKWVKGHSGNKYNDIADRLATEAIKLI